MARLRSSLVNGLGPLVARFPAAKQVLKRSEEGADRLRHSLASVMPQLIRPDPRSIFVTVTAHCNLRCMGCRYGRDFMPGSQLPVELVLPMLEDAQRLGISAVRFYGGEPLLHPHLPAMVEKAVGLGMHAWVTTNAMLLRQKIDALVAAGLRNVSIGFYGVDEAYDGYVQRPGRFPRLEEGVAYMRDRYGSNVELQLEWLLNRQSCNLEAVHAVWDFAKRHDAKIYVNLVHYSLPYFTEGPERMLQFLPEHRSMIEVVVKELIRLRSEEPGRFPGLTEVGMRSIPDWLLLKESMRVPCTAYRLLWVGADGSVQLCYVTFKLGNLHEKRLSEMLFTPEHKRASRDAFTLNCPNCHCGYGPRVERHRPSRLRYSSSDALGS